MSRPQRVVRGSDGGHLLPEGGDPELVWFVEASAAETWAVGYPAPDAAARAARAWAATAEAAAVTARSAAAAAGGSTVLVPADGTLARLVRLALPGAEPADHEAPTVVVETTGTGAGILDALAAARPGGCVLLAVRPLHRTTSLPSYHAIHRPELRVLPVPWADPTTDAPEQLIARALAQLAPARLR